MELVHLPAEEAAWLSNGSDIAGALFDALIFDAQVPHL